MYIAKRLTWSILTYRGTYKEGGVDMEGKLFRGGLAGIGTIVSYYVGNLTPLFYLLIGFEIADYLTGMAVAKWYPATPEDGWSSTKAIQGFIKKIAYIFLVGVAWGVDYLVHEMSRMAELPLEWSAYFGVFAVCYLILTEGISILENASKMGVEIPFFTTALKLFREKVSKKMTTGEDG